MIQNVLIICIGNICRSPIAEALLASRLKDSHPDVKVSSAGLGALVGSPADPISVELMQARSIDISLHRGRQATHELIFSSELILTMTTDQQQQIEKMYPNTKGRVHRIGKWDEFDIPDPFKRPRVIFEQTLVLIEQGIETWLERLWK
ncbi:MAG: protein tyrosine phosphatase [Legionellales bacterium RIFCSPHIGHO2_12_FULL_37_14]|nr:MAG: protein tyrosine phosphatase [Legionellales bacterium RIFCSPHIGHO2_12_FULL_37_14]